jgi:RNA recognition motif-containing protein
MKIYVGNLNFQTTEDSLREAFANYGEVQEVAVVTDRDTGRPRGFAFVTMPDDGQARAAIEALNGNDFEGRSLNVNEARPKTGGGGGGGGGRGGYGGGGGGGRGGSGGSGGSGGGGRRDRW